MIIPIQMKVLNESISFRPSRINFGTLTFKDQKRARNLEIHNLGSSPLALIGYLARPNGGELDYKFEIEWPKDNIVPSGARRTVKLAIQSGKDGKDLSGTVYIFTNGTNLTVPYFGNTLHGTLAYSRNSVLFRIPPAKMKPKSGCPSNGWMENEVVLTNRFSTPVLISNVSMNHRSFKLSVDKRMKGKVAQPGEQWSLCKIRFKPASSDKGKSLIISSLKVTTNVSVFNMAINAFDGLFEIYDPTESLEIPLRTTGKPKEHESSLKVKSRTIAIGSFSALKFIVKNPNPVVLKISQLRSSMVNINPRIVDSSMTIIETIPAKGQATLIVNFTSRTPMNDQETKITIKAEVPFFSDHSCQHARRQVRQVFPIKFSLIKGSLEWSPSRLVLPPAYAGSSSKLIIHAFNNFNVAVNIDSAKACNATTYGCLHDLAFSLRFFNKVLPPLKRIKVAEVEFNPSKTIIDERYLLPATTAIGYPSDEEVRKLDDLTSAWDLLQIQGRDVIERSLAFNLGFLGTGYLSLQGTIGLPRIFLEEQLDFGVVQVNTSRSLHLRIANPSAAPLEARLCPVKAGEREHNQFLLDRSVNLDSFIVPPGDEIEIGPILFIPQQTGEVEGTLYLRNNLTQLTKISLIGSSTDQTLFFDMVPEDSDIEKEPTAGSVPGGASQKSTSISDGIYTYHLMPVAPMTSTHANGSTHFWRLSMFNRGTEEVIVNGLRVGNYSCDDARNVEKADRNKKSHIRNCNLLPLHLGPGNSASFRVSTYANDLSNTKDPGSTFNSIYDFLFPLREHEFLVNTNAGDHRLLLKVALGGPISRLGLNDSGWHFYTLFFTLGTIGLTAKMVMKNRTVTSKSVTPPTETEMEHSGEHLPSELGRSRSRDARRKKLEKIKDSTKGKRKIEKAKAKKIVSPETTHKQRKVDKVATKEETKVESAATSKRSKRRKSRDKRKESDDTKGNSSGKNTFAQSKSKPTNIPKPSPLKTALNTPEAASAFGVTGIEPKRNSLINGGNTAVCVADKCEKRTMNATNAENPKATTPERNFAKKSSAAIKSNLAQQKISNAPASSAPAVPVPVQGKPALTQPPTQTKLRKDRKPEQISGSVNATPGKSGTKVRLTNAKRDDRRNKYSVRNRSKGGGTKVASNYSPSPSKAKAGARMPASASNKSRSERSVRRWGDKRGQASSLRQQYRERRNSGDSLDTRYNSDASSTSLAIGPSSARGNTVSRPRFSPIGTASPIRADQKASQSAGRPPSPLQMPIRSPIVQPHSQHLPDDNSMNVIYQPRLGGLGSLGLHGIGSGIGVSNKGQRYSFHHSQLSNATTPSQGNLAEGPKPQSSRQWASFQPSRTSFREDNFRNHGLNADSTSIFTPNWKNDAPRAPPGFPSRKEHNGNTGIWNSRPSIWNSGGPQKHSSQWRNHSSRAIGSSVTGENIGAESEATNPAELPSFFDFLDSTPVEKGEENKSNHESVD